MQRQVQLKQLAADADRRWKDKPSFLDRPEETQQSQPLLQPRDQGGYGHGQIHGDKVQEDGELAGSPEEVVGMVVDGQDVDEGDLKRQSRERRHEPQAFKQEQKKSPWDRERGGPSENWKPQSWTPDVARRK